MSNKPAEHYFTSAPLDPGKLQSVPVHLAGRDLLVSTTGGIFSPDSLDKGTEILLRSIPEPPTAGTLLDVGCGWGPIALSIAMQSPEAQVVGVDVNQASVELTELNAQQLQLGNVRAAFADRYLQELRELGKGVDGIWSNPPIRIGKEGLHQIMLDWLPMLNPGAQAWLVVSKNLGADSLQRWIADTFAPTHQIYREESSKGFRVLRVQRLAP